MKAREALLKGLTSDEVNIVFRLLAGAGFAIVPKACLLTVSDLLKTKWPTMADTVEGFATAKE